MDHTTRVGGGAALAATGTIGGAMFAKRWVADFVEMRPLIPKAAAEAGCRGGRRNMDALHALRIKSFAHGAGALAGVVALVGGVYLISRD